MSFLNRRFLNGCKTTGHKDAAFRAHGGFAVFLADAAAQRPLGCNLGIGDLDDVAGQAAKAGAKAAGVVIDDSAVTPQYVVGFAAVMLVMGWHPHAPHKGVVTGSAVTAQPQE